PYAPDHRPYFQRSDFAELRTMRKIVGWVGGDRKQRREEFQGLTIRGMRRNPMLMKRNEGACKEILIAPSKLPRFLDFLPQNFLWRWLFTHRPTWEVGFGYKSRGTDGKPTLTMTSWREPRHSTLLEVRKASSSSSRFRLPGWNLGALQGGRSMAAVC